MENRPTVAPTKAAFIERIETAYAEVEAAIARLSPAQLTTLHDADGWSAKDHIAHLAAWRRGLVALLEHGDMVGAMGVAPGQSLDETNAELYAQARNTSAAKALDDLRRAHRQVLAALAPLSVEDLELPYAHYRPGDHPAGDEPIYGWIAGNTFGHDADHLPALVSFASRA